MGGEWTSRERRVAAGMNGMVGIWDVDELNQMLSEPICVPEATVYPVFNSDGTKIVTLSGPFATMMNEMRVWDTSFRKPLTGDGRPRFDGKAAPPWLSELAVAITGARLTIDDDDLPPPGLTDIRKTYANSQVPEQYQIIWDRFLREPEPKQP